MKTKIHSNNDVEEYQIYDFLVKVKNEFPIPLDDKTDIKTTAHKLYTVGSVFCIKNGGQIVGLVAGYNNNVEDKLGYVSVLALLNEFRGKGLATMLVESFLEESKSAGMSKVFLLTHSTNISAIKLYKKIGFYERELKGNGDLVLEKEL